MGDNSIHEYSQDAELASVRTTLDRINKHMISFFESQKRSSEMIQKLNDTLHGGNLPGLDAKVAQLAETIEAHDALNKKLEEKLKIIDKYEKLLKWVLYVGVPTVLFNLGKLLVDMVHWAFQHGYYTN